MISDDDDVGYSLRSWPAYSKHNRLLSKYQEISPSIGSDGPYPTGDHTLFLLQFLNNF